jgi:hypothetical protein
MLGGVLGALGVPVATAAAAGQPSTPGSERGGREGRGRDRTTGDPQGRLTIAVNQTLVVLRADVQPTYLGLLFDAR